MAGLSAFLPGSAESPITAPLTAANPIAQNPVLQKSMELRMSAGPVDAINMMYTGMTDAKNRMDTLQGQLGPAQAAMAQGQQQLLSQLQQNYSPERESQLNWQALGNMGAAMMQPSTDAQPGGNSQWGRGAAAYQEQRNLNQQILDKAGNELATGQAALSKDDYARIMEQYKLAQTDYKDNRAGIVDWQKAIKTAYGGSEWDYKVVDGALWLTNKRDPLLSRAITDKSYAKMITEAQLAIEKEANDQDNAFLQQAQASGGGAPEAAALKQAYIDERMQTVLMRVPQSAVKPVSPEAQAKVEAPAGPVFRNAKSAQDVLNSPEASATDIEAAQAYLAANPMPVKQPDGSYVPGKPGAAPKAAPVVDTPKLEGDTKKNQKIGELQGIAIEKLPAVVDNATQTYELLKALDAHPGKKVATGKSSMIHWQDIPGTEAKGFMGILKQVQGKKFLEAFDMLRGGGAITEIEGIKATEAISRLNNDLPEEDFQIALNELRSVIGKGLARAYKQAGLTLPEDVQKLITKENAEAAKALPRKTINGVTYEKFGPGPNDWRVVK